jgi:hypothetical protein
MDRRSALRRTRRMGVRAVLRSEYDDIVAALGRPINTDLPRVRGVPKWAPEPQPRDLVPRVVAVVR